MIKRMIARTLVVLALAAGAVGLAAAPAQAAYVDCWPNYFCAWKNDGGTGAMYYWLPQVVGATTQIEGTWNDQISSVKNNTHMIVIMYQDAGCSSFWQSGWRPGQWGNLGAVTNNSISCMRWFHASQS